MDRSSFLKSVEQAAHESLVTEKELKAAYRRGVPHTRESMQSNAAKYLTIIGGALFLFGIVFLIAQHWEQIGSAGRVLVTLGSGLVTYAAGVILYRGGSSRPTALAFLVIAMIMIPVGIAILLTELAVEGDPLNAQIVISCTSLLFFVAALYTLRESLTGAASVMFGTWLFFVVTQKMAEGTSLLFSGSHFAEYRVILVGVAYWFLGWWLVKKDRAFSDAIAAIGTVCMLGAFLVLAGWKPHQNVFYEILTPLATLGIGYAGVFLRNMQQLKLSVVFIMIYIAKITFEYFANSTNWPIVLLVVGLILILVGYLGIALVRKVKSE